MLLILAHVCILPGTKLHALFPRLSHLHVEYSFLHHNNCPSFWVDTKITNTVYIIIVIVLNRISTVPQLHAINIWSISQYYVYCRIHIRATRCWNWQHCLNETVQEVLREATAHWTGQATAAVLTPSCILGKAKWLSLGGSVHGSLHAFKVLLWCPLIQVRKLGLFLVWAQI